MRSIVAASFLASAIATDLGDQLHAGHPDHAGFGGNHMERTFTSYKGLPMGEDALKAAGWHKHGDACDPHLGFVWTEDADGSTITNPLKLYTTAGGQRNGVGYIIIGWGADPLPPPQMMWATEEPLVKHQEMSPDLKVVHVDVAFRAGDIVCSGAKEAAVVGDQLILNPKSKSSAYLPLTESDAKSQGWKRGSCFDGMGWHYFLDTSPSTQAGQLSWKAENVFPIVTMFDKGEINAIFFASTVNQVGIPILMSNEWEPKGLSNPEMCKNLCDKDCTFSGLKGPTKAWSTAHIYFRDHRQVTCDANLKCGLPWPVRGNCCESSVVV